MYFKIEADSNDHINKNYLQFVHIAIAFILYSYIDKDFKAALVRKPLIMCILTVLCQSYFCYQSKMTEKTFSGLKYVSIFGYFCNNCLLNLF